MTGPERITTDLSSGRQRVRLLRQALIEVGGIKRQRAIGTLATVTAAEAKRLIDLGQAEAVATASIVIKAADGVRHLLLPGEITITKGAARRIAVTASTGSVDRQGDVIVQAGWQLGNFRKNPVVLRDHDPAQPIGRCSSIGVEHGALRAEVEFPAPGLSARSDEAWGLITAGILRAVSVGFRPLQVEPAKTGWLIRAAELLELSVVPIPANADCLFETPLPRPAGKSEARSGVAPTAPRHPTEPARAAEVRRLQRSCLPERAARLATAAAKAGRPRLAKAACQLAGMKP